MMSTLHDRVQQSRDAVYQRLQSLGFDPESPHLQLILRRTYEATDAAVHHAEEVATARFIDEGLALVAALRESEARVKHQQMQIVELRAQIKTLQSQLSHEKQSHIRASQEMTKTAIGSLSKNPRGDWRLSNIDGTPDSILIAGSLMARCCEALAERGLLTIHETQRSTGNG